MNAILDKYNIDILIVSSNRLNLTECRIDPQFFSANQNFIDGLETRPLSYFCSEIFNPPVFKREFLDDENECRYLASAEIVSYDHEYTFITHDQANRLRLKVEKGQVLLTGFGTIGNIRIVDNSIVNFAVANNVTRIIPHSGYLGFVACFLQSSYGNKLLNDYAAGAVIKYIEAPQISKLPIPVISHDILAKINSNYLKAVSCRENAFINLEAARSFVLNFNHLPSLSEATIQSLDNSSKTQIRLASTSEFTHDYRLDAHFYSNIFRSAKDDIIKYSHKNCKLSDVTNQIFMGNRFTRNLVDSKNGIPFIGTKNTLQIRSTELKFLSKTETSNLDELILRKEWILLARSGSLGGTFGKVSYVWKNFENNAGSEHIIRVCSDSMKIDSAYLFAYLSSVYGYLGITQLRHGALIDEIDPGDLGNILVPLPSDTQQKQIGDLVRLAYDLRAEAIHLEDEAQALLIKALING